MKKIICLIMICGVAALTGCNRTVVDFNYTFDTAIIQTSNGEKVFAITSWRDYEGEQLQLTLEDGSIILVSSYNTILVNKNGDGESLILKENA